MITVRRVGAGEWALWRDVRLAALTESPEAFRARLDDWADGGERRWRERLAMGDAYNVVAVRGGPAVGVASGVPDAGGGAWLHSVWVSSEVRGLGVGRRLVAAVEGWARGRGAAELRLAVLPGNGAAIELYRRQGFAPTGEAGETLPDGATELIMARPLR
ncbi:MAG TPA: GNAT family N-acetyltransferase [Streptosporangiaceae bacterium]|jgi:ribosomal protein S18 acetylase RimI-like enzyme